MLEKSCLVSCKEVKALPLFLFLLSLQFRDVCDLSWHRKEYECGGIPEVDDEELGLWQVFLDVKIKPS